MGINQQNQSPQAPQTPQQMQMQNQYQRIQQLRNSALSPAGVGSTTPGAGAAGGIASLAKALIANQQMKNWQKKWGVAPPQAPGAPASSAASGASGSADLAPQASSSSDTP